MTVGLTNLLTFVPFFSVAVCPLIIFLFSFQFFILFLVGSSVLLIFLNNYIACLEMTSSFENCLEYAPSIVEREVDWKITWNLIE